MSGARRGATGPATAFPYGRVVRAPVPAWIEVS